MRPCSQIAQPRHVDPIRFCELTLAQAGTSRTACTRRANRTRSSSSRHHRARRRRIVSHFYPQFQRISLSELPRNQPFYFIADDTNLTRVQTRFPAATVQHRGRRLFEVELPPG